VFKGTAKSVEPLRLRERVIGQQNTPERLNTSVKFIEYNPAI